MDWQFSKGLSMDWQFPKDSQWIDSSQVIVPHSSPWALLMDWQFPRGLSRYWRFPQRAVNGLAVLKDCQWIYSSPNWQFLRLSMISTKDFNELTVPKGQFHQGLPPKDCQWIYSSPRTVNELTVPPRTVNEFHLGLSMNWQFPQGVSMNWHFPLRTVNGLKVPPRTINGFTIPPRTAPYSRRRDLEKFWALALI